MTLSELIEDLQQHKVKVVAKIKDPVSGKTVIWFSNDPNPVFPFPLRNVHSIALSDDNPNQRINTEIIAALRRRFLPSVDD